MISSRTMSKKKTTKRVAGNRRRANVNSSKIAAFQVRCPEHILRWLDKASQERGLSRNQLVVMVLRTTQLHFEAAADAGLFKKLEAVSERAVLAGIKDLTSYASGEAGV